MEFICRTVAFLIHYLATQQVSQAAAAAEQSGSHLLLMPKVTLNSPGRTGPVYLVNGSAISLCTFTIRIISIVR